MCNRMYVGHSSCVCGVMREFNYVSLSVQIIHTEKYILESVEIHQSLLVRSSSFGVGMIQFASLSGPGIM